MISLLAISNRRGAQGQLRSKTKAIALVVSGIAVEIFFEHSLLTLKKTPLCDNPLANFSFSIKKKKSRNIGRTSEDFLKGLIHFWQILIIW